MHSDRTGEEQIGSSRIIRCLWETDGLRRSKTEIDLNQIRQLQAVCWSHVSQGDVRHARCGQRWSQIGKEIAGQDPGSSVGLNLGNPTESGSLNQRLSASPGDRSVISQARLVQPRTQWQSLR